MVNAGDYLRREVEVNTNAGFFFDYIVLAKRDY